MRVFVAKQGRSFTMSPLTKLSKLALSLAMFATFIVVSAVTTKADPITLINGGSGVAVVYTAAGFPGSTASAVFTLNGNTLTVELSNTSTDVNTALTALGFNTTPDITISNYVGTGVTSGWTVNGALGVFEVSRNGQGQGEAIDAGETETLTFTLLNFSGDLTIDLTQVHLQSLPDGSSQKPSGTEVPEPTSLLLLGSGLVTVAAGLRRRYRK
jgi:PEP-CTERM motif